MNLYFIVRLRIRKIGHRLKISTNFTNWFHKDEISYKNEYDNLYYVTSFKILYRLTGVCFHSSTLCFFFVLAYFVGKPLTKSRLLTALNKKAFENIVRKGENVGNQHFLLFPQ